MHIDAVRKKCLLGILNAILKENLCREEVLLRIQAELDGLNPWESDDLLITDCYFTLKHCLEEHICLGEFQYFADCIEGNRKYNLEEKML